MTLTTMTTGKSLFLILNLLYGMCGNRMPSVVSASVTTSLWLDCPCIYATEVNDNNRGTFSVNSSNPRFSRSDCVLVFVMGTASNVVQLELKDIQMQSNCAEYVELFPYLKEPVIENSTVPEHIMCHSHFKRNASLNYAPEELNEIVSPLDATATARRWQHTVTAPAVTQTMANATDSDSESQQELLFSGGRIYGLRVIFKPFSLRRQDNSTPLYIRGEYAFLDRANFTNNGRLIPGTYCDYYFFAEERVGGTHPDPNSVDNVWKYFHSPRYPANYAAHIQCTYKFIGRPDTQVEVIFEELILPPSTEICNWDKVTIYDAESPNVSSIIDVICETVHNKRIFSHGPDLLIEFNASANQTAKGFRGKFKFVDATTAISLKRTKPVLANPMLNEVFAHKSPTQHEQSQLYFQPTGSGSSSPLVNYAGS